MIFINPRPSKYLVVIYYNHKLSPSFTKPPFVLFLRHMYQALPICDRTLKYHIKIHIPILILTIYLSQF